MLDKEVSCIAMPNRTAKYGAGKNVRSKTEFQSRMLEASASASASSGNITIAGDVMPRFKVLVVEYLGGPVRFLWKERIRPAFVPLLFLLPLIPGKIGILEIHIYTLALSVPVLVKFDTNPR